MQKMFVLLSCLMEAMVFIFGQNAHGQEKPALEKKKPSIEFAMPELGTTFYSKEKEKEILTGPIAVELNIKSGTKRIDSTGVLHWLSTYTDRLSNKVIQKVSITYRLNDTWIFYDNVTLQQANIEEMYLRKFKVEIEHPLWYPRYDKKSIFPTPTVKPTRDWPLVIDLPESPKESKYELYRWMYQKAYHNLMVDLNMFDDKKLNVIIENLQICIQEMPDNIPSNDKKSLNKILDTVREIQKDLQERNRSWEKAIKDSQVEKDQTKNIYNTISSSTSRIQHFGYLNDIDTDDLFGSLFRVSIRAFATETLMRKQYAETNAALREIDDKLRSNILRIQQNFQRKFESHIETINTKYCEMMCWNASRYLIVNEEKKEGKLTEASESFKLFAAKTPFKNDPIVQLQLKFFEAATARDKDGLPAEWYIHKIALEAAQLIYLVPNKPEFADCRDTILQSAAEIAMIAARREYKRRASFEAKRSQSPTPESSYAITALTLLEYVESQKKLPDTTGIRKALLNEAYQRTGQPEKKVP